MRSRKTLFLAVVAVSVAFGIGGYVLGQQLESPEDARAEVAPPEASLITVPVELAELSNDVVITNVTAEFEGAVDLELDATLGDGASRVVTGMVPEVDAEIVEGDVAIEVSGRPVFLLEGGLPAFREFIPGLEGDDVLQLETALNRLGFLTVEPDRLYGSATEDAITQMYAEAGYEPRAATDSEQTQLEAAEDAVDNARTTLANANDGLSDLLQPPSQTQQTRDAQTRRALVDAITSAQEALAEAEADRPSNALLNAIDGLRRAELAGEGTDQANQAVDAAVDAEQARVDAAEDRLQQTRDALADYDEVQAAQDRDGVDTSGAQRSIQDATERLADAEADLAELEEDVGVRLPVAEVVFLPDLPRTITQVNVERGDFVSGAVMRISGTDVRLDTDVPESNRPDLEVGQRVLISNDGLAIDLEGEITELADRRGTNGVSDTRYFLEVTPTGEYSVTELVGVDFTLDIPLQRTEGEVLALPLAALSSTDDGSSTVQVERSDGSLDLVEIEIGLEDRNGSLVEITPVAGELSEGDMVVIGIEQPAPVVSADGEGDEG